MAADAAKPSKSSNGTVYLSRDKIKEGFRVVFNYGKAVCKPAKYNLLLAGMNPELVTAYLQEEVLLGRVVGPLPLGAIPKVQVSPFGIIPKGHTPGKWKLIVNLSSPDENSVNDDIIPELCSLSYINIDDISSVGQKNTAGLDIKSAYRIVPVHPEDKSLLGMQWKRLLYIDTCLPFGLWPASKIFTALADLCQGSGCIITI